MCPESNNVDVYLWLLLLASSFLLSNVSGKFSGKVSGAVSASGRVAVSAQLIHPTTAPVAGTSPLTTSKDRKLHNSIPNVKHLTLSKRLIYY